MNVIWKKSEEWSYQRRELFLHNVAMDGLEKDADVREGHWVIFEFMLKEDRE